MEHTNFEVNIEFVNGAFVFEFVEKSNGTGLIVFSLELCRFQTLNELWGEGNVKRIADFFVSQINLIGSIQNVRDICCHGFARSQKTRHCCQNCQFFYVTKHHA